VSPVSLCVLIAPSLVTLHRFLLLSLHKPELRAVSSAGLVSLSALDYDTRATGVSGLLARQTPFFLTELTSSPGNIEDPSSSEFRLLELLVASPWLAIQSDLSLFSKALSYLVWVLTELTKGKPSPSVLLITEQSSDPSTGILLQYGHLLSAVLEPVFSSDISVSKYFSELYSLAQDQHGGDVSRLSTEHCLRPNRLDSAQPLIVQVLRLLLSSHKWTESTALQMMRLDTLSLLLGQCWGEDEEGSLTFVGEQIPHLLMDLLTQVLPSASAPAAPLIVRQKAIALLAFLIRRSCPEIRIVPFTLRDSSIALPHWIVSGGVDSILEHLTSVCLNDSSDEIRLPALEVLLQLIPFVARESTIAKHAHFEGLIDCLLSHSLHGKPTEDILARLDLALRSVAMLDPALFESLVRARFSSITVAQKAPNNVAEYFSGLIDHAGLLTQFQQSSGRRSEQAVPPPQTEPL
jgi:hypothetical protein